VKKDSTTGVGCGPSLFLLFISFLRMGSTAFGGAFGSVPLLFHEIVEARGWMDAPTFLNGIVLGQFTPGPIVITATFVGYLLYGIPGALAATLAVFSPSFIILIAVAPWFDRQLNDEDDRLLAQPGRLGPVESRRSPLLAGRRREMEAPMEVAESLGRMGRGVSVSQ
jgi:hypothetical protein